MGLFSKIKSVFKKTPQEVPGRSKADVKCVDLSHHNEKVSLPSLIGMELVILKATEGKSFVDSKFQSRWLGLKSLAIKRGAYHFYRTNVDPIVQASHFIRTCEGLKPGDILALDYETCSIKGLIQTMDDLKAHKQDAIKFMSHVELITGIKPWFYTYHSVIQSCDFGQEFAQYPLWYARYTSVKPEDKQGPWSSMVAWQYADNGVVDGISNNVDMNILKL
jgi:lysozyme